MSSSFQPFLISEFTTGLYNYLESWIRPAEAFEPLINAYIYRGVLTKRNGSTVFGTQLTDATPVMGIMQYQNEATGQTQLVVASTKAAYLYTAGATPDGGTFAAITSIGGANSTFYQADVTVATTTIPSSLTFWPNLVPSSVTIVATDISAFPNVIVGTVTDDGVGGFGANGIFLSGTINYVTGAVSFSVAIASSYTLLLSITATTTGSYFTGNISNFFNYTNWQATSSITALSPSYLYMANNIDPVTIYDGTHLARPILYVDTTNSPYIQYALDVKTYNNRLLLLRPKISSESNPSYQDIYFSAQFSPFNFVGDVPGNGGAESAATGDMIMSARFLRDNLIIAFSKSVWSFQITGLKAPPFVFRRLNSTKSCNCPYAGIQFDERVRNLGNTGIIDCDGVNAQRTDLNIIDYYETQIDQQYFNQCFSLRYDNLQQAWMLYSSVGNTNPLVGGVAPGSDQVLIYNFLENTWATYALSAPMTCLGSFYVTSGVTWAEMTNTWEDTPGTWASYSTQATQPFLLGGDTNGFVYHLDNAQAVQDAVQNGTESFNVEIKSSRWNPFLQLARRTQFGYLDVYYRVAYDTGGDPIEVTINFYVSNDNSIAASRLLKFDGPPNADLAMKRIYCNLIGEFVQIEIDPSEDAPIEILGFIIWAKPAGRLTP